MHHLTQPEWIAIAAHRLQRTWRTIDPDQLEDVAADLWADDVWRAQEPARAVDAWLAPILAAGVAVSASGAR